MPSSLRALALLPFAASALGSTPQVNFESFEYTGRDRVFAEPLDPGHFRNPILAGFHPDPDICRVGSDYYIVNSSFAYFPGIPIFHSRDLVNWRQIGNVVSRPEQLDYRGLGVSRGVFAPALSHHDGTFYLICTFADAGGIFLMTARSPAGPWSAPTWLGFDGIDPSLFFGSDGRAWIVNNGPPPDGKPLYDGHRAIWLQEFGLAAMKMVGPRTVIVNGGANIADHPVWIEGPHLFEKDGWHYLVCAEGGTSEQHSEVVFRSRDVRGPYFPGPANPILTQRTLPSSRPNPVTCTGHADLVETETGQWWSVFLGCRPYEGGFFNTGRETFMLPVTWTDGWPTILAPGTPVPYTVASPNGVSADSAESPPLAGNFTWSDNFPGPALSAPWIGIRGLPKVNFGTDYFSGLLLAPSKDTLWGNGRPAYVGYRIQHSRFTAGTYVKMFVTDNISAGLVAFQNESHHYYLGVRQTDKGIEVFVERVNGGPAEIIARALEKDETTRIMLRISCDGAKCDFGYSPEPGEWHALLYGADATLLSTEAAGGFVGATVGLHARIDP